MLRILLGFIFLWAAVDKIFGLGFDTAVGEGWLAGNSPTFGFLNFGTRGPFAGIMKAMAGNVVVDILFIVGQIGIGVALLLGVGLTIAGYAGALQMALIYLAAIPPVYNPIVDQHIVYIVLLVAIAWFKPGETFGLGKTWKNMDIVKKYSFLE
ncbi:MAG TPA: hypothetical protein VLL52_00030 [Anaerolineae bacterium]|nr:hypothetical protein [Anaerolineae bacterium]